MAARTLVQKFKCYTEVSDQDRDVIYNFLYVQKGIFLQGDTLSIEVDEVDQLTIIVDKDDSKTIITCLPEHMNVWVGRHFRETRSGETSWGSEHNFELKYDVTPEWMFQLSTQYDLGFLEHRYIKYLRKLHDMYSTEEEENVS
jgi:hypothetical protein